MVEHAERSTYPSYLSEMIHFQVPTATQNPREIAKLYLEQRLSSAQIAQKLGCTKGYILLNLKRLGLLRRKSEAKTDPTNYRSSNPPYGFRIADHKLVTYAAEIKVCRMIVDLIDRKGLNKSQAAERLIQKGIKNRAGVVNWRNSTVTRIYKQWKNKL